MSTPAAEFDNALSARVWQRKYRYGGGSAASAETSIADTWHRVAAAAASVERSDESGWRRRFFAALEGFRFLPAGRILASAGTDYDATLFNCFVMGTIEDSIDGIFDRLKESAQTMQRGGGIGCDFSTLRPRGSAATGSGRTSSGAVSFMNLWDEMCRTLLSTGTRRGAMMGTLRCDHPDIGEFIDAKRTGEALTNFNVSVQITDAFLAAVAADRDWALVFPGEPADANQESLQRDWPGFDAPVRCTVHARVPAASIWRQIADAAYDSAEPGVLFVDRINAWNNLHYRETITTTNPCGEVPLPPCGACNLASINLAVHVEAPFTARARLDLDALGALARDATRFLDNVIDLSRFPLATQHVEAHATRRVGLGITGLADALIMLGLGYDSDAGRDAAQAALTRIRDEAWLASIEIAREKGAFPAFDKDAYLAGRYVESLPARIRDGIAEHGIRNSHLLSIAPAGSISILANNASSGIEPVYAPLVRRALIEPDGTRSVHEVRDFACELWRRTRTSGNELPDAYVGAHELSAEGHLAMAAALQPLVDNAISKTINVPESTDRDSFRAVYRRAYDLGLKGCTVFRENSRLGAILSSATADASARAAAAAEAAAPAASGTAGTHAAAAVAAGVTEIAHCCVPEREGD